MWVASGIANKLAPYLPSTIRRTIKALVIGDREAGWARYAMDRETKSLVRATTYREFDALEISGQKWKEFGFKTYSDVHYPDFDICQSSLPTEFDIVIAEQVFEHLRSPDKAVRNVFRMLRPNGYFLVTTPFLIKIHDTPMDCTRWSERGLKYLLVDGGFEESYIVTGSWGNRACVKANFSTWSPYIYWRHSLQNEPEFPVSVWGFAKKVAR